MEIKGKNVNKFTYSFASIYEENRKQNLKLNCIPTIHNYNIKI